MNDPCAIYVDADNCIVTPACPAQTYVPAQTVQRAVLGWNAGANSIPDINGNFHAVFDMPPGEIGVIFGVRSGRTHPTMPDFVEHAFYFTSLAGADLVHVIELGQNKTLPVVRGAADTFEIRRVGVKVTYWRNNVLLYSSVTPSSGAKLINACLYASGDHIGQAGSPAPPGAALLDLGGGNSDIVCDANAPAPGPEFPNANGDLGKITLTPVAVMGPDTPTLTVTFPMRRSAGPSYGTAYYGWLNIYIHFAETFFGVFPGIGTYPLSYVIRASNGTILMQSEDGYSVDINNYEGDDALLALTSNGGAIYLNQATSPDGAIWDLAPFDNGTMTLSITLPQNVIDRLVSSSDVAVTSVELEVKTGACS